MCELVEVLKSKISSNKISFRGKTYEIKLMRCNAPLKNAL